MAAIYSEARLQNARRFEANTLESGVFFNDGTGVFSFSALPRIAQVFPIQDIAIADFTRDGFPDIYLVGNSYGPQPETGNMDGGISLLLAGVHSGGFRPIWPDESGLVVTGDARGVATCDLNGDDNLDIIVAVNNAEVIAFEASD